MGEARERKLRDMLGRAYVSIGHCNLFGRRFEDREVGFSPVGFIEVMAISSRVVRHCRDIVDVEGMRDWIAVEVDVVCLVEKLCGTFDGSGESIPCITPVVQNGLGFVVEDFVAVIDSQAVLGLLGFCGVGTDVLSPRDLVVKKFVFVCIESSSLLPSQEPASRFTFEGTGHAVVLLCVVGLRFVVCYCGFVERWWVCSILG